MRTIPKPARTNCDFCNEFAGGKQNAYSQRYGPTQRTVLRNEAFRIVPTLGQIAEGHLLIIPTAHYCALADLPSALNELDSLCQQVRAALTEAHGKCIFFEHGIRGEGSGGCGINHAHMHAVPVEGGGVLDAIRRDFHGHEINRFKEVKDATERTSSYLYFEDAFETRHVFPVENLPSQYMRKLVAESIGKPHWDWRKCGREPELISTIQRLTPLLSSFTTFGV